MAPSGHHRRRVGMEPRIPLAERRLPFTVQHAGADLQQQVSPPLAPSHLLLLHHTLAHHVVHRRLDKAGADALAGAIALAIVGPNPTLMSPTAKSPPVAVTHLSAK